MHFSFDLSGASREPWRKCAGQHFRCPEVFVAPVSQPVDVSRFLLDVARGGVKDEKICRLTAPKFLGDIPSMPPLGALARATGLARGNDSEPPSQGFFSDLPRSSRRPLTFCFVSRCSKGSSKGIRLFSVSDVRALACARKLRGRGDPWIAPSE